MGDTNTQPTYLRQRFLLSFINQLKGSVTSTDLQKLVFLNSMCEGMDFYTFVPYKYGAYSFQLSADIDTLYKNGYLSIDSTKNSNRIKSVENNIINTSYKIAQERGDTLIRKSYCEHPYYAIKSEILDRILGDDELIHINNIKNQFAEKEKVIFTIGYEGKSIESFINDLIRNNIRALCDVRKTPISRKFGFSKSRLKHISNTAGIEYFHIPELGIQSGERKSLSTMEDYQRLFKDYKKSLPTRILFIEHIYSLLQSHKRIALMCYELDPKMCHRHIIKDYLVNSHTIRSIDLL